MLTVLSVLAQLLVPMRSSRVSRDAEILFLRQQLLVLRRSAPARLRLRNTDRLIFVWLYRLFPSLLNAAVIFKPETLGALAPWWFSPVLALEVTAAKWPPSDSSRHP